LHFAFPASPQDYLEMPIAMLKVGALGTHKALGLAKAKGGVDTRIVHDRRVVSNFVVQALQGKPLTVFGDGNQTRGSSYAPEVELEEGSGVAVRNVESIGRG
jgi:hypothetical protein